MAKTSFSNRAAKPAPAEVEETEAEEVAAPATKKPLGKPAASAAVKSVVKPAPVEVKVEEVEEEEKTEAEADAPAPPKKTAAPKKAALIEEETLDAETSDERTVALPKESGVTGYIDRSMFEIPSLKLVQSIGPMSENFEAGIFVLNGETPLCDPEGPITLSVLRLKVDFEENLEWGTEERARVCATPDEVREVGGWLEWIDNKKPPFSPRATALVAVLRPEGLEDDPSFPFEDDNGNFWSLALWTLKGTQFTSAAKKFITASEFGLKGKLHYGVWTIVTKREMKGKNLVWCAKPTRQSALLEKEVASFLLSLAS